MRFVKRLDSDRGASMVLVAVSLLLLLGASAIAVDLAALRLDRSLDQKVTDSAASAGALAALDSTGQEACEAALAYVAVNTESIGSIDATDCSTEFASTCTPGDDITVFEGRYEITVTYPVENDDPLMTSAQLGAPNQPPVSEDGDPCERVGVQMNATHQSHFAQLIGFDQGTTTVHAVARAFLPPPDGPPINLLLLDRFGCEVMKASGSSNAGIIVEAIVDGSETFPGEGAVDSDATVDGVPPSECPVDGGTIDIDGNNAQIRADGEPGSCPNEDPPGSGQGCGLLRTLAPGTPGCNWPACTAGGAGPNVPNPDPTALPARLTRAPIDHRYNCRVDGYETSDPAWFWAADPLTMANEQDIPPCAGPHDPNIHQLIAEVKVSGLPTNGPFSDGPWQTWSAIPEVMALDDPCVVDPGASLPTFTGNIWVDGCASLDVKDPLTIVDGSMVLDGDLAITSGDGHLTFDNDDPDEGPGFLFMRSGLIRKDGQASLSLFETMVYLSKSSRVQMDGGDTGTLTWIAPEDEDHPFDDLALWSDSTITSAPHSWQGQSTLNLEGVFFVPIVSVEYAGQGTQQQVKAQFISDKLHARGQGELVVAPIAGRAVDLTAVPRTTLIR